MSPVTLRDIATRLKLSPAAVSMGLHNSPRISGETKKRIRTVARELGYRPNLLLSDLASSRWQKAKAAEGSVIAYIDRLRSNISLGSLLDSGRQHAASLGYRFEIFRREEFTSSIKLQKALRNRGITDVILGPVFEESLTLELDWSKFICVQVLSGLFQLPLHNVVKDHFNAVLLAWQKAVERGYTRIGVILLDHPAPIIDDIQRASATYACQNELYPHLPTLPVLRIRLYDPGACSAVYQMGEGSSARSHRGLLQL